MIRRWRGGALFALVALAGALLLTRGLVAQPGYTDAYYYFNAAERLVRGDGLTDAYLWTYLAEPDSLPAPSHLYWMPITSLLAALGMWLAGAPGDYAAAQWPFTLALAGASGVAYWLGGRIGGTARHRWVAGLITLSGGFYARFWGMTDAFAPFALIGALALVCAGLGLRYLHDGDSPWRAWRWWALAGALAALGHLTRADGLLLLLAGIAALLWPWDWPRIEPKQRRTKLVALLALIAAYLLVMSPWLLRNLQVAGSPLPAGGLNAIWYTEYDDLFRYPPGVSPDEFFADGLQALWSTRWTAFSNNLGTFVAIEGLIAMTPLMLVGLWRRRRDPFLRAFWLYALGLHLAMTFVFPLPGYRGGLLHSAVALIPWWAALGVAGLDDVVMAIARRRQSWKPRQAQRVFSVGLVLLALALSWSIGTANRVAAGTPGHYPQLAALLPDSARVMINDPAQLYYFTGLGGVVTPNAEPDAIPQIARRYGVTHLLIEYTGRGDSLTLAVPQRLAFDLDAPPPYLTEIPFESSGMRLYVINP
ncbi:MAG: hypothetical protein ACOCZH_01440 [Phototrophicaceae bacterium]